MKNNIRKLKTLLFALLLFANLAYANNVKQLFIDMKEKFENIEDATCIMDDYQSKNGKSEQYVYNHYYKKPDRVRMDIIGGDKDVGTILIYRNGKVKVKPGKGVLSLFTFTLNPNDKRILGLRGYRVNDTTGRYFLDRHIEHLDNFYGKVLRQETIDGKNTLVIELISKDPDKTSSVSRELIWVDKKEKVLLKFILYDVNGEILQSTYYKNLEINKGLDDELFEKTAIGNK